MNNLDVVLAPDLIHRYTINQVVVLVDVLRFTSSLVSVLDCGALFVETYADIETPLKLKNEGYVIAGERNGIKIDGYTCGNSPLEFSRQIVEGKKVAFSTTNGTYTKSLAVGYEKLITGAFVNLSAVVDLLLKIDKSVTILCSGTNRKVCIEDTLFAGALVEYLQQSGKFDLSNDASYIAFNLYSACKGNMRDFALSCSPFLRKKYDRFKKDIDYVFEEDLSSIVPGEVEGRFVVVNN